MSTCTYPNIDLVVVEKLDSKTDLNVIILRGKIGPRAPQKDFSVFVGPNMKINFHILANSDFLPNAEQGGFSVVDIVPCTKKEWEENKKEIVTKALRDLINNKALRDLINNKGSTWSPKTVTWSYNDIKYKCFSDEETKNNFVKNARERSGLESTEVNANAVQNHLLQPFFARLF